MKLFDKHSAKRTRKGAGIAAKKLLPILLSVLLIAGTAIPTFAIDTSSGKEEVIYVNLDADGRVREVYVVNIFSGGSVTDYGDYSSVEMLNTTDKITQNADTVSFTSTADRVYYKGKMKNAVIPWDISIRYYMDGEEYSAKEIAGESGRLEIQLKITKNESCSKSFFEDYALQAAFTLDTEKCENIQADGATVANVGSKKQISYTCLPGEGVDATITADVKNFEMDAVSINGVPLSMNIEIDDAELMDKITELMEAIAELDDGASELQDAAEDDLQAGTDKLADGVKDLKKGAADLDDGAKLLNAGIALVESGLTGLNAKSPELTRGSDEVYEALLKIQQNLSAISASAEKIDELVLGSSEIKKGIDTLSENVAALKSNTGFAAYKSVMSENKVDIDKLQTSNEQTVQTLTEQVKTLNEQIAYLKQNGGNSEQIAQFEASSKQLQGIVTLLKGNNAAIDGAEAYLNEIEKSVGELSAGVDDLKTKYKELYDGINELAAEVKEMLVNMSALKGGIDELVTKYGELDSGINEYTDFVAEIVAGYSEVVNGSKDLLTGSNTLKNGTAELYGKTSELSDGVKDLVSGISELHDGTNELRIETDDMDDEISDKIDEMLDSITGKSGEIVSFVSEKNTNIKSVQFVIQTESIKIAETSTAVVPVEESLTLWQKILRLFGLY